LYPINSIIPLWRIAKRVLLCVEFLKNQIHARRISLFNNSCNIGECMAITSCFHYWWSDKTEKDLL